MSTATESPSTADAAPHVRRTRQPADVIARNTEHLPERQRNALRWLHAYAHEQNLTNGRLAALIDYSESTISRLFSSEMTYEGDLDAVCDAIMRVRAEIEAEEKNDGRRARFTETNLSRHIWKLCDLARSYQRIVFMYGDSQIGKSRNLKEKARRERGSSVYYFEMPVGGALSNFLANAAEAMGFSGADNKAVLRRRLINTLKVPKGHQPPIVIIDQMHRCFSDARGNMLTKLSNAQLATLDFIIEMFDSHAPGIVLSGTPVFREGMEALMHAKFLVQLRRRSLNPKGFPLPDRPSEADLRIFAKDHGLPPASGEALALQARVIEESRLGVWLTLLSMALHTARKAKKPITWDHVVNSDDFLAAAAKGKIAVREEAA